MQTLRIEMKTLLNSDEIRNIKSQCELKNIRADIEMKTTANSGQQQFVNLSAQHEDITQQMLNDIVQQFVKKIPTTTKQISELLSGQKTEKKTEFFHERTRSNEDLFLRFKNKEIQPFKETYSHFLAAISRFQDPAPQQSSEQVYSPTIKVPGKRF